MRSLSYDYDIKTNLLLKTIQNPQNKMLVISSVAFEELISDFDVGRFEVLHD